MDDLQRLRAEADRHARAADWAAAAKGWVEAAQRAEDLERPDLAWECWDRAGEGWRRADWPAFAARALFRALDLAGDQVLPAAVVRIKLAAVLSEMGDPARAVVVLGNIREDTNGTALHPLATDSWVGAMLVLGRKDDVRAVVDALPPQGDAAVARLFRLGQLDVLDGRLDDAAMRFTTILQDMKRHPRGAPAVASALTALAEVAELRGDAGEAVARFDAALEHHDRAGRRAMRLATEAGRIKAMVLAGAEPLVHGLDEALAYARERELASLELGLQTAIGLWMASRHPSDGARALRWVIARGQATGRPLSVAFARWALATRFVGSPGERLALLDAAAADAVPSRPLAARIALARAEALAETEPALALATAREAGSLLDEMGMVGDASRAAALVARLG